MGLAGPPYQLDTEDKKKEEIYDDSKASNLN